MLPLIVASGAATARADSPPDPRGNQFLGVTNFAQFARSPGAQSNEVVLISPVIQAALDWRELIVSWNAAMPDDSSLKIEVQAISADRTTRYYSMGLWSANTNRHPRESVVNQKDDDGDIATDTLTLKRPADRLRIRLTLGGGTGPLPDVRFLGLCLTDPAATPAPLPPNRAAWGKLVDVPERSQMAYPGGDTWCSPTTTSMLLLHWSRVLHRPELDFSVPEVVRQVFDPNWPGTGNWAFNMAFAGSFPDLRACVSRFSEVSEIEDWIAAGLPVGLSVCYNKLRGKPGPLSGHLVVCVGFTENGDVIANDPGTREHVRKTFSRANLIAAWATSKNAVYLVYPTDATLPRDRFGHWAPSARLPTEKPAP